LDGSLRGIPPPLMNPGQDSFLDFHGSELFYLTTLFTHSCVQTKFAGASACCRPSLFFLPDHIQHIFFLATLGSLCRGNLSSSLTLFPPFFQQLYTDGCSPFLRSIWAFFHSIRWVAGFSQPDFFLLCSASNEQLSYLFPRPRGFFHRKSRCPFPPFSVSFFTLPPFPPLLT